MSWHAGLRAEILELFTEANERRKFDARELWRAWRKQQHREWYRFNKRRHKQGCYRRRREVTAELKAQRAQQAPWTPPPPTPRPDLDALYRSQPCP